MSNIRYCLKKILCNVFFLLKFFKLMEGLVGFGNLRFAEIKSRPSDQQTSELKRSGVVAISCHLETIAKSFFLHDDDDDDDHGHDDHDDDGDDLTG